MFADNGVYFKISQLNMELYTDKKRPGAGRKTGGYPDRP
jgi:hypothetical protein